MIQGEGGGLSARRLSISSLDTDTVLENCEVDVYLECDEVEK